MRNTLLKVQNVNILLLHGTSWVINSFDILLFELHNNIVEVGRVDTISIN